MIQFDHIEVHVTNPLTYSKFLKKIFGGGRYKKISDNGTYMFLSNDLFHIEVKKANNSSIVNEISNVGFQFPCLRMKGALDHLNNISELKIDYNIENPDGACYFFTDYEGIKWHIKDYEILDKYVNI
jgi:hypothetical protein